VTAETAQSAGVQPARELRIRVEVNARAVEETVEARLLLVHFLRERLRLTGTKIGCDTTSCGACTVLLDGRAVRSCTMFAVQADGSRIDTVEGLGTPSLTPLQDAFWEEHGLQCGFCTPGMLMAATDLLSRNPDPDEDAVRAGISGNLCRCTGYQGIVAAILRAAAVMRETESAGAGTPGETSEP
jgi:carbon-monoxide dehydrogenase small subunit